MLLNYISFSMSSMSPLKREYFFEPLKREYSWDQVQIESVISFIRASDFVTRLPNV